MKLQHDLLAMVSGLLFALGLGLSGMVLPEKVIGFLDVFGDWDGTLVLVLLSAVGFYAVAFPLIMRRPVPIFSERFYVPTRRDIDLRLVAGAAVFGTGWGISGLCPGPALVSLLTGSLDIILFSAAMFAGMALHKMIS